MRAAEKKRIKLMSKRHRRTQKKKTATPKTHTNTSIPRKRGEEGEREEGEFTFQ